MPVFKSKRTGVYLGSPKVRLLVEQTYGRADAVSLPFYKHAESILSHAGFEVVKEDATTYDATYRIEATGTPRGSNYHTIGWQWSGANLNGTISLTKQYVIMHTTTIYFNLYYCPLDRILK